MGYQLDDEPDMSSPWLSPDDAARLGADDPQP